MKTINDTARALIGSLMIRGNAADVAHIVRPEMFPTELLKAAKYIFSRHDAGAGFGIGDVSDAAGWTRTEKNEIRDAAEPMLMVANAEAIRDAWLASQEAAIYEQAAAELAGGADAFETNAKVEILRERLRDGMIDPPSHRAALINAALERIVKAMSNDGISGITTGWADVDHFAGGWQEGDLVILGARPGMGKTTVALAHARAAAEAGTPVAILSLEMTAEQLVSKWIAEACGITAGQLRNGHITSDDWAKIYAQAEALHDLPVHFVDTASMPRTLAGLRDRARLLVEREGVRLIVVDYLQLLEGSDSRLSRNYQVEEISRGLKKLALQCRVPVIALSQLSREIEKRSNKRPVLSDLRDSGSVEQDADLVVFLNRPEYYGILEDENGDSLAGVLEYIIAKDRIGGIPKIFRRYWYNAQYHARPKSEDDAPAPSSANASDALSMAGARPGMDQDLLF